MLRRTLAILSIGLLAGAPLDATTDTGSLRDAPILGDRLSGFVLPILPIKSDLSLQATRVFRWKVDDTQRLALEGDIRITMGGYAFSSRDALVWINRVPSADGVITQVALWFPSVTESSRGAGLGVEGRNVLVTGSLRGSVRLSAPVLLEQAPAREVTAPGDARVAAYLSGIAAAPATLSTLTKVDTPRPLPEPPLEVRPKAVATGAAGAAATPAASPAEPPRRGDLVTFAGREVNVEEKSDVVTVLGGAQVDVLSRDPTQAGAEMRLSAERAVLFLRPGSMQRLRAGTGQADAGDIEGVYLEGDVLATDGDYAVRGAQVYYDVASGRAAALQAVLRTHMRGGIPVVSRAAEVRQVAKDQFEARDASVSLSEFHTPHLSVGAERIMVTRGPAQDPSTRIEARGVTVRSGGTPIFYWPQIEGEASEPVLPEVLAGWNRYQGVNVGTRWDLWKLAGWRPPFAMDAELAQDLYTKNGIGLGTRFSGQPGSLNLYGFYDFQNTEQSSAGVEYTSALQWRGLIDGATTVPLDGGSLIQGQLAWVSDGAWISTFKQDDFANRREYETSGFVKLQSGNSAFDALVKYDLDRYVTNSWMLASRPYSVSKFPEVSYRRYGDSLFDGQLTWTQEYNANAMALQLESGSPLGLAVPWAGFNGRGGAFGTAVGQNTDLNQAYFNAGYNEDTYVRTFTRQELALPLGDETVRLVPFAQATAIGYLTNEFQSYANQYAPAGSNGGTFRGVVGGGMRMSASFSQDFDGVQSSTFDLNRLRWVVEPNGTLWAGYDSTNNGEYPIFDQDVEAISAASVAQLGLTQRWKTWRGGPGDWRSVDWAMLDFGAVVNNSGAEYQRAGTAAGLGSLAYFQSPTPQFFSWRPELSQWGNHGYARGTLALSSSLTAYGSTTLLFEDRNTSANAGEGNFARGSVGLSLQHSPDVSFFCEYRTINNFYDSALYPNDELLQPGVAYQIGKLYTLSAGPQIDLGQGDLRALSATLSRAFPDFNLGAAIGYSAITDQYSFGMRLSIPAATSQGLALPGNSASDTGNAWSGLNPSAF